MELFPYADVLVAPLSLSIACHVGPGTLAVAATRKMVEEYEDGLEASQGLLS